MRKSTAALMVSGMLVVCLFPAWGRMLPGSDHAVTEENRNLSRFPGVQTPLAEWPGAVENWFGDRLAFRNEAIRFSSLFEFTEVKMAVEGRNGWLYYLGNGSKEDMLRRITLSSTEKESIRAAQAETARRLSEAGTAYAVLICPDKQTIYPEYLPDVFRNVSGQSRMDQILPVLREIPGITVVDPRDEMLRAKGEVPLYYLTDTHWNRCGAWIACKVACEEITRVLPSFRVPEGAEISEPYAREQGDLAQMLNRRDMKDYEVDVTLPGTDLRTEEIHNPDNPLRNTIIFENPAHPELPHAIIFHDSFGEALRSFLAAGFSRAVFAWSDHVDMRIVNEEKPDIVIQEYVERLCSYGLPVPPAE